MCVCQKVPRFSSQLWGMPSFSNSSHAQSVPRPQTLSELLAAPHLEQMSAMIPWEVSENLTRRNLWMPCIPREHGKTRARLRKQQTHSHYAVEFTFILYFNFPIYELGTGARSYLKLMCYAFLKPMAGLPLSETEGASMGKGWLGGGNRRRGGRETMVRM